MAIRVLAPYHHGTAVQLTPRVEIQTTSSAQSPEFNTLAQKHSIDSLHANSAAQTHSCSPAGRRIENWHVRGRAQLITIPPLEWMGVGVGWDTVDVEVSQRVTNPVRGEPERWRGEDDHSHQCLGRPGTVGCANFVN